MKDKNLKRLLPLLLLVSALLTHCGDPEGGGLVYDPDQIGEGIDPGKVGSACYPPFADNELNVVTWNIERFSEENTDLDKVQEIVEDLDADVIAVQEINDLSDFQRLANALPEYQTRYVDIGGSLDLGFLVKVGVFDRVGNVSVEFNALLRPAVGLNLTHASGLEVTLLNIHLKCCSEGRDERIAASNIMKAILDENYADQAVILLGDFNDEIVSTSSPFRNFILDAQNYRFADMGVAVGNSSNFSYPSWPSHIDHILITDELFDKVGLVQTIKADECVSGYSFNVSDHRPVLASFK